MGQATSGHDLEERRAEVVFKKTFVTFPKSVCLDNVFGRSLVSYADWEGTIIPTLQAPEQV